MQTGVREISHGDLMHQRVYPDFPCLLYLEFLFHSLATTSDKSDVS